VILSGAGEEEKEAAAPGGLPSPIKTIPAMKLLSASSSPFFF